MTKPNLHEPDAVKQHIAYLVPSLRPRSETHTHYSGCYRTRQTLQTVIRWRNEYGGLKVDRAWAFSTEANSERARTTKIAILRIKSALGRRVITLLSVEGGVDQSLVYQSEETKDGQDVRTVLKAQTLENLSGDRKHRKNI